MISDFIATKTGLPKQTVLQTLSLLDDGSTIPFIARYRKELTGNLSEENLFKIEECGNLYKKILSRKETIINALKDQNLLSADLEAQIQHTWDQSELEDLYLPFKQKRKTKAEVARKLGLEPLAKVIMSQKHQDIPVLQRCTYQ